MKHLTTYVLVFFSISLLGYLSLNEFFQHSPTGAFGFETGSIRVFAVDKNNEVINAKFEVFNPEKQKIISQTDSEVKVILPDGNYVAFVYAEGYAEKSLKFRIMNGENLETIVALNRIFS